MQFNEPLKVYEAETNVEAHLIVSLLEANGIAAFAEEGQPGVSVGLFGPLCQFHSPGIWIENSSAQAAAVVISQFEKRKRERAMPRAGKSLISVQCEECGKDSTFADELNGTVQECPSCGSYVDVGHFDWPVEDGG